MDALRWYDLWLRGVNDATQGIQYVKSDSAWNMIEYAAYLAGWKSFNRQATEWNDSR